ncbi:protein of unknown function DUF1400 [Gloeothece citriformis PCC 7424]|uniref:DUF1400 domain-containing protein n=1 Tax=Gloeothece citriformis (strain PCC 7424) TaxID=65393 RepID=B7KII6_GLOC7|nr:alpha/beta hydrolase [Gloeothece citriformis]ACK69392.1 protein of unknown function DUF1400 [Gloeothece citriformis PCC 7424]
MIFNQLKLNLLKLSLIAGLGIGLVTFIPKSALSAERLYFVYGPLKFSLSVDSLETYAKEGRLTKEFAFYANFIDKETLSNLREILQQRHTIDHVRFSRLLRTPMMEDLLKGMGEIFSTHYNYNGFYAIRSALILAALNQDEEGWTAIDIMRYFPTEGIRIDLKLASKLMKNDGFAASN